MAGASVAPRYDPPQFYSTVEQMRPAEKNRVQKILEDANVKLGTVLSDVFGVSGQLMLEALLEGKTPPGQVFGRAAD